MACDAAGCLGEELRPAGRGSGRHEGRGAKGRAMSKMTLKTEGDRHVVVTRRFAASPEAVYRAHTRAEADPEVASRPGGLDDARLCQRGATGREDPLRVDGRQGGRVPSNRRISGVGTIQPNRSRGADAPARPDAGQPR